MRYLSAILLAAVLGLPASAADAPAKHPWLVMADKIDAQIAEWTRLKKEDAGKLPTALHMLKVAAAIAEKGYLIRAKEICELATDKEPDKAAKLLAALAESTVPWGLWQFGGSRLYIVPGAAWGRGDRPGVYRNVSQDMTLTVTGFTAKLVWPSRGELQGVRVK